MTRFEVVFVAIPTIGNLVPVVEFANLLTKHDPRFYATVFTVQTPQRPFINTYVRARASPATNLRLLQLLTVDPPAPDQYQSLIGFLSLHIQNHKHHFKDALLKLISAESNSSDSVKLVAFFADMFSTTLIDVAAEANVPCYLFFASPASFLGFTLHLPRVNSAESESEFEIPSFNNPLPRTVFPNLVLDANDGFSWLSYNASRYRQTKGIVVNTLHELEPHALQSLCDDDLPRVYPIGPVIDLVGSTQWDPNPTQCKRIMEWLDNQPPSSVVFLCFGSLGSMKTNQVEEIAIGLERSGFRFLWALREPPKAQLQDPRDYTNYKGVLPDGFLERTSEIGLVCGWVPQAKVLAHSSVGGFVSHCGWNSILESLWHGVPIATWPVYGEQQMNAFQMVKELGLAVEISLDYRHGADLVRADVVEKGVRSLMEGGEEIRKKVKKMSEVCRGALTENGSSYRNLVSLVQVLTGPMSNP